MYADIVRHTSALHGVCVLLLGLPVHVFHVYILIIHKSTGQDQQVLCSTHTQTLTSAHARTHARSLAEVRLRHAEGITVGSIPVRDIPLVGGLLSNSLRPELVYQHPK